MRFEKQARDVSAAIAHRFWAWMRWAGAIGPEDRVARAFYRFGAGSIIAFPPGDTFGQEHISIGECTILAGHVTLSAGMAPGRPLATGAQTPILRIGDRTVIGRGNHLVAHRSLVIGDDVMTGPNCYFTDQNHTYVDPRVPVGQQYPSDDPVEIGSGSWVGAGAVILPGTQLGRNCVVAAGAVVRGHFPDNSVLAGVPAKVVRHYDPANGWQPQLKELLIEPPEDWPTPVPNLH